MLIEIGAEFVITKKGEARGYGPAGSRAVVRQITDNGGENIGMEFEDNWSGDYHNMNGLLDGNRGYWIRHSDLLSSGFFSQVNIDKVVKSDYIFKGKNLKGKKVKVLARLDKEHVMAAFEENIGGCSGDGKGKAGHCVVMRNEALVAIEKGEKTSNKS
jgi:hypothetical protein